MAGWRWKEEDLLYTWYQLTHYRDLILMAYLERVNIFREMSKDQILNTQAMVANAAQWRTMLEILQIDYRLVMPRTWQGKQELQNWKKRRARLNLHGKNVLLCPLNMARHRWPQAPLKYENTEGIATALLIADTARQDHVNRCTPVWTSTRRSKARLWDKYLEKNLREA